MAPTPSLHIHQCLNKPPVRSALRSTWKEARGVSVCDWRRRWRGDVE